MTDANYGICPTCRKHVPAEHVFRDGNAYLKKACAECGETEALISTNAEAWKRRRELYRYRTGPHSRCTMHCKSCVLDHRVSRMVFLDVTNRCDMNCPICVANVPAMGFEFHPPLLYFEKIFAGLARMDPKPVVHLFGGEPTMREDLFDIVDCARREGLTVYMVTNGLKLADEEFCKKVCEKDLPVLLGFDGRDPEIYGLMRRAPGVLDKKLKALDNLRKDPKSRSNIIMCCVARGVNDDKMGDIIEFCHEHRSHLKGLYLLPLVETWDDDRMPADATTTPEDAEQFMQDAFPGEDVGFLPLGLQHHFARALSFYGVGERQTFSSVHPNCESCAVMVSDGERYQPLGHYMKQPLDELADAAVGRAQKLDGVLSRLDARSGFQRLIGRVLAFFGFFGILRKGVNAKLLMKGEPWRNTFRLLKGLLKGGKMSEQFRENTALRDVLRLMVLPFQEIHALESERLRRCTAGFAFEDPDTGEVRTMPTCAWWLYNTSILERTAAKYSGEKSTPAVSA